MIPYNNATFCLSSGTLDIFFAGCSIRCEGCHNEELWDSSGNTKSPQELTELIDSPLVKTVRLMGGEPQEQDDLLKLLQYIPQSKAVWLFTGRTEVDMAYYPYVDYIKLGGYERDSEGYEAEGVQLASSNQKIIKGGAV